MPWGAAVSAAISYKSSKDQAKAARAGAKGQEALGYAAIDAQVEANQTLREDLAPYANLGLDVLPQAENLFGTSAFQSVKNDPVLQAIQDDARRRVMASQASRGRLGTGETANMLQDAFARTSLGFLGQQRSDFLNALTLGQSSAAQQAVAGLQTGQNVGNLLTQIGNVQAAGTVGAANAQSAGLQNLASIGGGLAGYYQNYRNQNPRTVNLSDTSYGGAGDYVG